jgi:membrane protein required for colicin V production
MPITILDMIVIGVVLISALLASLRGFTREVLAIGSWAVAAAVAYAFHPQAIPLVQQYISTNKSLAVPIAAGGIFLATLLVAYFVTSKLSDMILDSSIGALDRTLGFLFGAARGMLLAVVCFLFFNWLAPDDKQQPSWVRDAKLKPMLISAGETLRGFLPDNPEEALKRLKVRPPEGEAPKEPAPEPQKRTEGPTPAPTAAVASPSDRASLQRLIDTGLRPAQNR